MQNTTERSDRSMLDLLNQRGPMSIADLTAAMNVTPTAVRQRLSRVMAQGLVQREPARMGRGRPSHRYSLTPKGRRHSGSNFADLTLALWREVRAIQDPATRTGLLQRIAASLAELYGGRMPGQTTEERMKGITALMAERNVTFAVENGSPDQYGRLLPVLTARSCPYPELAEQDRAICAVERMLFSELLGEKVRLSECRLDGASCCRFETN